MLTSTNEEAARRWEARERERAKEVTAAKRRRWRHESRLRSRSLVDVYNEALGEFRLGKVCPSSVERRLEMLPPAERGDAALDVLEDQLAREALDVAVRVDEAMVLRHATRPPASPGITPLPDKEWKGLLDQRDRVLDQLLKLRERRRRIEHLDNMNVRGAQVVRFMPPPAPVERGARAVRKGGHA